MAMLILMCISDPEGLKASRGERGLATSGERGQTVNLIHPGLPRLTELPWEERSLYGDGRLTNPRIFIRTRGAAGLLSRGEERGCWGLVEQGFEYGMMWR